jgi:ABC-2 type transport system ATP-binding protein
MPILEMHGVRKAYGRTVALDGVDLTVEAGTVLGLLGRNGAGKSTLVSIVAGLRRPDAGRVEVRGSIGLAPQDTGVYMPLSVRDNLRYFGGLAGLRGRPLHRRIDEIACELMLDELLTRPASQLSGGERRRLHTAIALIHRPRLVLLDEPTTGADVQTRAQLLRTVRALADEGTAVVYSTHYLPEIESLAADVAFIDHGRIVASGSVDELVRRFGSSALQLNFEGTVPAVVRVQGAVVNGTSVRIPSEDPSNLAAQLLPRIRRDAGLRGIELVRPTLESVFVAVTGERYHQDAA